MASNDWKRRQFELLLKLRDVCEKENIKMILCGESALAVYRDFSLNDNPTIAIHAYDVDRFIGAVEQIRDDIVVESMLTNNKYPLFDLRFCDKNTTDFDVNSFELIDNNCIHISVKFIETIPSVEVFFLMWRAKFKEYSNSVRSNPAGDGPDSAPKLFKHMIKCASGRPNYKKSYCKIVGKKFPARVFETVKTIEIDGEKLTVPERIEEYLECEFGITWRFHECEAYVESPGCFRTTAFSWSDYSNAIKDVDFEKYQKASAEFKRISKLFHKEHKKVLHCYQVLERTFDRIYLWQKYMPVKDEIKELFEKKKYEELKFILEEYYKFLDKHERKDLGLCFDQEIMDIALELIRLDGHEEYAKRLRELVPARHLEEIRIKNYKGEIIE